MLNPYILKTKHVTFLTKVKTEQQHNLNCMSVAVQHPKKNKNLFIHIHLFDSNFSK